MTDKRKVAIKKLYDKILDLLEHIRKAKDKEETVV